ncbi:hypothetical protein M758_7G030400 [Ceratodon purpureus]|nr:hypothetical protein M758_7G030400 [Ceratodon purpureus]
MKPLVAILIMCFMHTQVDVMGMSTEPYPKRNAYATIIYMGTPRDYEFFTAARVLFQSLIKLKTDADLIVIASRTIPQTWIKTLTYEGIIVKVVKDIPNPYAKNPKFERRFIFTLNKIHGWSLTEYERVVMLDVDNVFLRAPDELFQCGEFCAAFINPCIFHTGLFVLKPSNETFFKMLKEVHKKIPNKDGADQGFLTSHFHDLLDRPLFHPPIDGTERLTGLYRLPESYQMDAALYYLNLKWHTPCGLNSAITFPSIPMLKPWFWWSYPILPLGILWHEKRLETIGYRSDIHILIIQVCFYLFCLSVTLFIQRRSPYALVSERSSSTKMCMNRSHFVEQSPCHPIVRKSIIMIILILSYILPFSIVPTTIHPILGWANFLLGSLTFLVITINLFKLNILPVMIPWLEGFGMLLVMFWPYHSSGISRSLIMTTYAFLSSPSLWWCFKKLFLSPNGSESWEPLMTRTTLKHDVVTESSKLC